MEVVPTCGYEVVPLVVDVDVLDDVRRGPHQRLHLVVVREQQLGHQEDEPEGGVSGGRGGKQAEVLLFLCCGGWWGGGEGALTA